MTTKNGELVPRGTTAVSALPSFIDVTDKTGKDVVISSVTLPRLGIAQGASPELNPDGSKYIDGLKLYDFFNTVTQEVYGRGPLRFIPIKHRVTYIEFDPNDRNKVLHFDVPASDPRTKWGDKDPMTGKSQKPAATEFQEFIIVLLHDDGRREPIMLSIKCTNRHNRLAAERLAMLMAGTRGPAFCAYKYVESKTESQGTDKFGVFVIRNAGNMHDTPEERDLYFWAKEFAAGVEGKVIDVEGREPGDDDVSFDTEKLEQQDTSGM
jgi:hypothetical protein